MHASGGAAILAPEHQSFATARWILHENRALGRHSVLPLYRLKSLCFVLTYHTMLAFVHLVSLVHANAERPENGFVGAAADSHSIDGSAMSTVPDLSFI
jgi:hypothetical protein